MYTINCPKEEDDIEGWFADNHPKDMFKDDFLYTCFQLEQGSNFHIQGYIYFNTRKALSTLKNNYDETIHWEPRKGSHSQAKHYCSKPHDGPVDTLHSCGILGCHTDNISCGCKHCCAEKAEPTVIPKSFEEYGDDSTIPNGQGDRSDLKKIKEIIDNKGKRAREDIQEEHFGDWIRYKNHFEGYMNEVHNKKVKADWKKVMDRQVMFDWQKEVVKDLDEQNDRQVIWVVDEVGDVGKSWLVKWLQVNRGAVKFGNDSPIDMAYKYDCEEYCVFNFTRSDAYEIPYKFIEDLKDCQVFSPKYYSQDKYVLRTKVLCMSNFHPEKEKLSQDRWQIIILK